MMRTGFQKETVAGPKDGGKSSVSSKQTSLLGTAGEDEAPGPRAEASWLLRGLQVELWALIVYTKC